MLCSTSIMRCIFIRVHDACSWQWIFSKTPTTLYRPMQSHPYHPHRHPDAMCKVNKLTWDAKYWSSQSLGCDMCISLISPLWYTVTVDLSHSPMKLPSYWERTPVGTKCSFTTSSRDESFIRDQSKLCSFSTVSFSSTMDRAIELRDLK